MAGVFKNLDRSDIRITPFRAYKAFSGASSYTTYLAEVSSTPAELGNDALDSNATLYTTDSVLKDSVWRSINHLFYQNYYDNTKASFGSYNHKNQPRQLLGAAGVVSLPQRYVGEGIAPNTLELVIAGVTYTNDIYNNLVPTTNRWGTNNAGFISASNVVFSLKPTRHTKDYLQTVNYTFASASEVAYGTDQYPSDVQVQNCKVGWSENVQYTTTLQLQQISSIVVRPIAPEYDRAFNFTNRNFAVSLTFDASSVTATTCSLIEKFETVYTSSIDLNGNIQTQQVKRYPYILSRLSSGKIQFRKSDGVNTLTYTSSFTYGGGTLTLSRSGSTFFLYNGSVDVDSFTDTFASTSIDYLCANDSPIYIGSNERLTQTNGLIVGNVHFYDTHISSQVQNNALNRTDAYFRNNPYATAGNVFPQHGMIVVTDDKVRQNLRDSGVSSMQYRGTTTIYENEYSCTISPGEFNFSNNPTLQKYSALTNQYELTDFATGSAFKPYITQIGLYNDYGQLLVAGKLSQPIQLPSKVDTTIIVKFDR